MRALVLDPAGNLFGSERVLLDFLEARRDPRWEITLCTPPGPLAERARTLVRVIPTFIPELHRRGRWARARALGALLRAATRERPDLIHVNQAGATRIALWAARALRIPVVTHVRIYEDVVYVERLAPSERHVPAVVCVSHDVRSRFSALRPRCRVFYDPYRQRLREQPRRTSSAVRVACVGRIVPVKRQHVLVEAIAVLRARGVDARLSLIGPTLDPDYERTIRAIIAEHGLDEVVRWTGMQDDVLSILVREADLLVCPSWEEPLGRVAFEALDAGIVPIGYRGSGGLAEVIGGSGAGLLFDDMEGRSIAEAIAAHERIPPPERAAMVDRGRAWMSENVAPDGYGERVLQLWDEVCARRR